VRLTELTIDLYMTIWNLKSYWYLLLIY